jgi:mono/diheme cytochrome c family protein
MTVLAATTLLSLLVAGCGGGERSGGTLSAGEVLTSELSADVPEWVEAEKLPSAAVPGAQLFALSGCTACHTYLDSGATNLGAPDLTAAGLRRRGIAFRIGHLICPACVHPGSPMPKYGSLGERRLRQLAVFLEASKGRR